MLASTTGQPEGQQSKEMTEKESAEVESQILPPQYALFILKTKRKELVPPDLKRR